jgi:hypothetical protein
LHALAARLAAGDIDLVRELGDMLATAEREARTLRVRVARAQRAS